MRAGELSQESGVAKRTFMNKQFKLIKAIFKVQMIYFGPLIFTKVNSKKRPAV